jgi:hypothetical protein
VDKITQERETNDAFLVDNLPASPNKVLVSNISTRTGSENQKAYRTEKCSKLKLHTLKENWHSYQLTKLNGSNF